MGGYSSGRHGGKRTTNDMHVLDIRKIARAGLLKPGCSFNWQWTCNGEKIASIRLRTEADRVVFDYRTRNHGDDWQDMHYPVYLAWSGCNYGGQRGWWLCPAAGCGRRVAVLYGGKVYACRQCHKLAYRTQRQQPHARACGQADKLRYQLGWEAGILNGNGSKPKGMHWQTFERLQAAHDGLIDKSLRLTVFKFGLS